MPGENGWDCVTAQVCSEMVDARSDLAAISNAHRLFNHPCQYCRSVRLSGAEDDQFDLQRLRVGCGCETVLRAVSQEIYLIDVMHCEGSPARCKSHSGTSGVDRAAERTRAGPEGLPDQK
jgi:hypothetical protein